MNAHSLLGLDKGFFMLYICSRNNNNKTQIKIWNLSDRIDNLNSTCHTVI